MKWHNNGQLEMRSYYINGKENGIQEWWFENGNLRARITIVNDNPDGLEECWHKNGTIYSRRSYKNGNIINDYVRYNRKGMIIASSRIKIDEC